MAIDPQFREKFKSPEIFLAELLKKSAKGQFHERDENVPFLFRAFVVAVDTAGGNLENKNGDKSVTHVIDGKKVTIKANVGPENPRNSVKARIITDGFDQFVSDDRLRVFWPFFPEHISVPVKPGEHIYVLFEDRNYEHGLWVTKVPGHQGVNFFKGEDSFSSNQERKLSNLFSDTRGLSEEQEEDLSTDESASEQYVKENRLSKLF